MTPLFTELICKNGGYGMDKKKLLITDIDHTLIGNPRALKQLIELIQSVQNKLLFGIATGRNIESTRKILHDWNIPLPSVMVTAVGTEIYYGDGENMDHDWEKHIQHDWFPEKIKRVMSRFPGLESQPEDVQRPYKLSYYSGGEYKISKYEVMKELMEYHLLTKVIQAKEIFLDILPIRASKGLAIEYVARKLEIPMERILVAGDSGNDEEMLFSTPKGIVVGNYSHELDYLKKKNGVYFAKGHFASGILEGIQHFQFI